MSFTRLHPYTKDLPYSALDPGFASFSAESAVVKYAGFSLPCRDGVVPSYQPVEVMIYTYCCHDEVLLFANVLTRGTVNPRHKTNPVFWKASNGVLRLQPTNCVTPGLDPSVYDIPLSEYQDILSSQLSNAYSADGFSLDQTLLWDLDRDRICLPCQPPIGGCPPGFNWNQPSCQCESECPPGSTYSLELQQCVPDEPDDTNGTWSMTYMIITTATYSTESYTYLDVTESVPSVNPAGSNFLLDKFRNFPSGSSYDINRYEDGSVAEVYASAYLDISGFPNMYAYVDQQPILDDGSFPAKWGIPYNPDRNLFSNPNGTLGITGYSNDGSLPSSSVQSFIGFELTKDGEVVWRSLEKGPSANSTPPPPPEGDDICWYQHWLYYLIYPNLPATVIVRTPGRLGDPPPSFPSEYDEIAFPFVKIKLTEFYTFGACPGEAP